MSTAVPAFFVQTKFQSFTRQLNGWGFKRLHQTGADFSCYYHECFLRGIPQLTRLMSRVSSKRGKLKPDAEGEPDFYLIARLYPLPPSVVSFTHESSALDTSSSAATTMTAASSIPYTAPYEMTHCNNAQNQVVSLAQADSSTSFAAATTMTKPESSAYNYSNASNQQKDSSGTSQGAATTMISPSSIPYTTPYEMTHWNNAQNPMMPLAQAESVPHSSATTMTSASMPMFHFPSDETRGGTNISMASDHAAFTPAPVAAVGPTTAVMPAFFGAPMSYQHSYQMEDVDTTQNPTKPPRTNYDSSCQMSNHVESGCHPGTSIHSKQDFFSHVFNPSKSSPISTLTHNNYHYQGVHNHHSTQVQHQPSYYPQGSTSSTAGQEEELDGSIEETPHDVNHMQGMPPGILCTKFWATDF
mmetsp:Transcript_32070/g.59228  ORF Transcript_32070/g.59228 Transcript_32070/m.59228 type:complete len:414 (+) Transcript_32070:597-1838(+)